MLITNLFSVSRVESQQFQPFPEDTSTKLTIEDLKDYPMTVVYPM